GSGGGNVGVAAAPTDTSAGSRAHQLVRRSPRDGAPQGHSPLPGRLPTACSAVRVGLSRVFGLARSTADRIVAERARRPWSSLADLIERGRPALPELEALILGGALDATGRSRPSLLLEARVTAANGSGLRGGLSRKPRERADRLASHGARHHDRERALILAAPDGHEVLPAPVPPVAIPELPEFDLAERVRGECRATGLWFSAHPLDVWLDAGARRGAVAARALDRH